jgi:hypothetical protein
MKVKIGDIIKCKAATRHHYKVAIRRVTNVLSNGDVWVTKYHGWKDFIVHPHEILEVVKEIENNV